MPETPEKVQSGNVYKNTKKTERKGFAQSFTGLYTGFAHVVRILSTIRYYLSTK
jgi:hypothetical protein